MLGLPRALVNETRIMVLTLSMHSRGSSLNHLDHNKCHYSQSHDASPLSALEHLLFLKTCMSLLVFLILIIFVVFFIRKVSCYFLATFYSLFDYLPQPLILKFKRLREII